MFLLLTVCLARDCEVVAENRKGDVVRQRQVSERLARLDSVTLTTRFCSRRGAAGAGKQHRPDMKADRRASRYTRLPTGTRGRLSKKIYSAAPRYRPRLRCPSHTQQATCTPKELATREDCILPASRC